MLHRILYKLNSFVLKKVIYLLALQLIFVYFNKLTIYPHLTEKAKKIPMDSTVPLNY